MNIPVLIPMLSMLVVAEEGGQQREQSCCLITEEIFPVSGAEMTYLSLTAARAVSRQL